jgi:hypothetical protein
VSFEADQAAQVLPDPGVVVLPIVAVHGALGPLGKVVMDGVSMVPSSTSAKHAARAPGGAGARAGRRPGRPVSWTTARPISIALGVAGGWLPVK